jgi:hypothetical protein
LEKPFPYSIISWSEMLIVARYKSNVSLEGEKHTTLFFWETLPGKAERQPDPMTNHPSA